MQWILQDVTIGQNIRRLRDNAGLTQQQVVEKLQLHGSLISRTTYAKIETGARNIRASDLILLRVVFKVDYSEFFKGFDHTL